MPELRRYRAGLDRPRAAVYTGGAFKAFSLVRSLRTLGMQTVLVGSQTGNKEDYKLLRELCDEGTILVDDTNPLELSRFVQEKEVDLFIGGVKERPIAYKLGIGFCDHNHERKEALAGFEGMLNFAREVHRSVMSARCGNWCPRDGANAMSRRAVMICLPIDADAHRKPDSTDRSRPRATPASSARPLGACLAFRGIEGAMPFLHGSQGCPPTSAAT